MARSKDAILRLHRAITVSSLRLNSFISGGTKDTSAANLGRLNRWAAEVEDAIANLNRIPRAVTEVVGPTVATSAAASEVPLYREHFFAIDPADANRPPTGEADFFDNNFVDDEAGSPGIYELTGTTTPNFGVWWAVQDFHAPYIPQVGNTKLRIRARIVEFGGATGTGKCGITTDSLVKTGAGPTNGNIAALTSTMTTYEFTSGPAAGGHIFVGGWDDTDAVRVHIDLVEIVPT